MAEKIKSFLPDLIQKLNEKSEKNGIKYMTLNGDIFVNFNFLTK